MKTSQDKCEECGRDTYRSICLFTKQWANQAWTRDWLNDSPCCSVLCAYSLCHKRKEQSSDIREYAFCWEYSNDDRIHRVASDVIAVVEIQHLRSQLAQAIEKGKIHSDIRELVETILFQV